MSDPATELLRRLGSGVRPVDAGSGFGQLADGAPPIDFGTLLADARRGALRTGRAVEFAGMDEPSDAAVRRSLADVVDTAEAAGVHTLAAIVGPRVMRVLVGDRRVTDEVDVAEGTRLIREVDAVAVVTDDGTIAQGWSVGAHDGPAIRLGVPTNRSVRTAAG